MPALVVLDTNALLLPFERRLRVEAELDRLLGSWQGAVPEPCLAELARIAAKAKGARRNRAKMALTFGARFEAVPADPPADSAALKVAQERRGYLFTNDADLVRRAKAVHVAVIRMRGLSHLIIESADET